MNPVWKSKRVWLAIGAVVAIVASSVFGVDEDKVNQLVAIAVGLIVGDSVRPTNPTKRY